MLCVPSVLISAYCMCCFLKIYLVALDLVFYNIVRYNKKAFWTFLKSQVLIYMPQAKSSLVTFDI